MSKLNYPLILISKKRRGIDSVWVRFSERSDGVQLRHVLFFRDREVEVIEANGTLMDEATIAICGIRWSAYSRYQLLGFLVAFISAIFMTILVDYEIEVSNNKKELTIAEIKKKIFASIRSLPNDNIGVGEQAFFRRLSAAKDFDKIANIIENGLG